jgi:HTH-type transcriptional regulator, competence development regulator
MNCSKLPDIGKIIRQLREDNGEPLRRVAAYLDIDQAILSKIERGKRQAKKKDIIKLAEYFCVNEEELLVSWLSSRIVQDLQNEALAEKALELAKAQISHIKASKSGLQHLKTKSSD